MEQERKFFGRTKDGREVFLYCVENKNGMRMEVTDFGAILVSLWVPDKDGILRDVVLGYDKLAPYEDNFDMLGATVGRNVNRIEDGRFFIDGVEYRLEINENGNNIHSHMEKGFHKVLWEASRPADNSVSFFYHSPDGENGFPGNLDIRVTYTLTEENGLLLSYCGKSDQKTLLNLTNHSYFNLDGGESEDILDTLVQINADGYTPVKEGLIPTGEIASVSGTPFDFREEKSIRQDIEAECRQLEITGGYDHNFVLNGQNCGMRKAASARSLKSGIRMTVYTDLPGLQFYSGNMTRNTVGKGGRLIHRRSGFCMESHYYPNSINIAEFPQPVYGAGEEYKTSTLYQFSH